MAQVTLKEVLELHDGAVGAFSTYDLYTAQGIVQGAEEAGLPVILMIGSGPLNKPGNEYVGQIMVQLAKEASVPVCVFLDHSKDYKTCLKAIKLGFSAVMIDGSHLPLEENIAITNKVTEAAQALGVSVEAELGALAGIEDGEEVKQAKMTDPAHVEEFLNKTNVDALAVSIGNAHGLYKGEPKLDFERLKTIAGIAKDVPLVLHGGTGLTLAQFAKGVELGIKKINIGTEVKKTYIDAFINTHEKNVSAFDMVEIPQACKKAVSEMVKEKLEFFAKGWKKLV
ncbi:MAG: fructose-bisphosphate aldolase, class [Clostridia bacterium]|jgi:fructose-bisphosphate aldolase class II|nr:fructose-bisphosphate aldolase, class [Clostridia bacterium]MDN5322049.1 fructose-bisphosphate aldolase, class [Clostridia bacterium]